MNEAPATSDRSEKLPSGPELVIQKPENLRAILTVIPTEKCLLDEDGEELCFTEHLSFMEEAADLLDYNKYKIGFTSTIVLIADHVDGKFTVRLDANPRH